MQNRPWLLKWLNKKMKNYYARKENADGDDEEAR
jgi:hypothetical protein